MICGSRTRIRRLGWRGWNISAKLALKEWHAAKAQFAIQFGGRFVIEERPGIGLHTEFLTLPVAKGGLSSLTYYDTNYGMASDGDASHSTATYYDFS